MCLSNIKASLIAEKDITVYKVVDPMGGTIKSIYMGYVYKKDKTKEPVVGLEVINSNQVQEGYHSFADTQSAAQDNNRFPEWPFVIMKFTIPKGTKYYEGIFNYCPSYASETIICTGEVVPWMG